MDYATASSFVYAKAKGMIAKSFVGTRINKIFTVQSLGELWSLLFKSEVPLVPEVMLAKKIEQEIELRFISDFKKLLDAFDEPNDFCKVLLQKYDYGNLKEFSSALLVGMTQKPFYYDIGKYALLRYKKWPSIAGLTEETVLSWYKEAPSRKQQAYYDSLLDQHYIFELWDALKTVPKKQRTILQDYLSEEFILQNIIWALRLKIYYSMTNDEILTHLAFSTKEKNKDDILVQPALKILEYPLDSYEVWSSWKYKDLVNTSVDTASWRIDPRWVEHSAQVMLYKKAYALFHRYSECSLCLFCLYKIKQYETNCVRTCAEGLRLHVYGQDSLSFVENTQQAPLFTDNA
ncbi:MAG: hypothetical protein E7062_08625 [Spirochaetaceae bacterium]|nr:hypothetical protein [Spirochaetaceae bacterium]